MYIFIMEGYELEELREIIALFKETLLPCCNEDCPYRNPRFRMCLGCHGCRLCCNCANRKKSCEICNGNILTCGCINPD